MTDLDFTAPVGGARVKVDQAPQKGAGVGLSWDQLGAKEQVTARLLYPEPESLGITFEQFISRLNLTLDIYDLEVSSGKNVDIEVADLTFAGYDLIQAAGASVDLDFLEFNIIPYDMERPWEFDLAEALTFVGYDISPAGGVSFNMELSSLTFTSYDVTPTAAPNMELTLHGSAQGTTSANLPVGTQAGDLCICIHNIATDGFGTPVPGTPSGFTSGFYQPSAAVTGRVTYKLLAGGETTITPGGTFVGEACTKLYVFRPNKPISSIAFKDWEGYSGSGNPPAQSPDPSAEPPSSVIVASAHGVSGSFVMSSTPSLTESVGVDTGSMYNRHGYRIYNSAPAAHSIDMPDQGNFNLLMSGYVQVQ